MARKIFLILALLPSLLVAEPGPNEHEQTMHDISATIMSPFCPGRLLRDCPSGSASDLRSQILDRLQKGESRKEIEESLITVYGESMRAAPRARGFGLLAWVMPFLALLAGFLFWMYWLKFKTADSKEESSPPLSDKMRERIEKLTKGS